MTRPPVDLVALVQKISDHYNTNGFDDVDVDTELDVDDTVPAADVTEVELTLTPCQFDNDYFDVERYTDALMMDATDRFGLMAAPFNTHRVSWVAKDTDLAKLRKPGCVNVFFTDGDEVRFQFDWMASTAKAKAKAKAKATATKTKVKPTARNSKKKARR